ncbi:MAG TPA: MotA/TolQ/ExbB proton channel family protein, partial [Planctomycetota bacterium]|nr:MotA/TolQ/ExbB proton channel family protein [Planctomycetota bacterium]
MTSSYPSLIRSLAARISLAACLCLALSLVNPLPAAESAPAGASAPGTPAADISVAAREARIIQLLQQLLAERTELAAMRRDHQRQLDDFDANRFVLERAIAGRDQEIAAAQKDEAAAFDALVAAQKDLQSQRHASRAWLQILQTYPPNLREHLAHAVDAERSARLQACEDLAQALANPGAAPADLLQRVNRLQEAEEALARSIERTPVRVEANREVDGLRIGAALVIAPTENGGAVALTPPANNSQDAVHTPIDAQSAQGLTLALQILQRRRSPEFTDIYLPTVAAPNPPAVAPAPVTPIPTSPDAPLAPAARLPAPPPALTATPAPAAPATLPTATPAAAAADPLVRLEGDLTALRAQKAAFAASAAAERKTALDALDALEAAEASRAQWLKTARAKIAEQQSARETANDDLQLERERQGLFTQALDATRDQLLERLTGSLEATAQPALAADLTALRTATADPAQRLNTVLDIYARLLTATQTVSAFTMQVKLADGRLITAHCLQLSLLGGFFTDPDSHQAGVLVADASQAGLWRGESRGLSVAQCQAIARRIENPAEPGLLPLDVSGGAALIQATHAWTVIEWFEAGGKVMWPLLLVAIAGTLLVAERLVALLRLQGRTRDLLGRVEAALVAGRFDEAQALCDPTRGPVQRVLHAGLIHRHDSRTVIEDAIQAAALGEMPALQKGLGMIALLAGLAPLLGLLGTVTGMITTFQMVNLFGSSDTRFLAGGISEALITTDFGLFMAIPFVFLHGVLTRLSERILTSIELGAAMLVQRLSKPAAVQNA